MDRESEYQYKKVDIFDEPEQTLRPDTQDNGVESQQSTEKPPDIRIREPVYEEPQNSVRFPSIRRDTQIQGLMNHDIYIQNSDRPKLNSHSSVPELTFRNPGSSLSKESKATGIHSHTKSSASIFKERYDKNIENYMHTLESRYQNRKNQSIDISKLMSPHYSTTKRRHLDL